MKAKCLVSVDHVDQCRLIFYLYTEPDPQQERISHPYCESNGKQGLFNLDSMTLPPAILPTLSTWVVRRHHRQHASMKTKEILGWPEMRDLVRFFIGRTITGHLHRKAVFWETMRQLSDPSGKLATSRRSNTTMCIGHRHGHGNHGLRSPLVPYLCAIDSETTRVSKWSACLERPQLPHRGKP